MRAYWSRNFHRSFVFRRFARYSAPWGRTSLTASLPMVVAESGGPTMFARIGVMRALNRNVERVFRPGWKDHPWGRRKLKRGM